MPAKHRAILTVCYAAGLRISEAVCQRPAKVDFFIKRYGSSPHILCWELRKDFPFELELEAPKWLVEMTAHIRHADPNNYLVSLQCVSGVTWPKWIVRHPTVPISTRVQAGEVPSMSRRLLRSSKKRSFRESEHDFAIQTRAWSRGTIDLRADGPH